jgi:DNA-binding Xre family transcriptional regulator
MIGNKISALLGERRVRIKDFAIGMNLSYPAAHKLYHAKSDSISWDVLDKLCTYFGVGPSEIFPWTPNEVVTDNSQADKNTSTDKSASAE